MKKIKLKDFDENDGIFIDLENKTYEDITNTNTYEGNNNIDIESKIKNEI